MRKIFRCPVCEIALERQTTLRNAFDCPRCGESIRAKRWSGFRFISAAIRSAACAAIVIGAAKLRVFHWPHWQLFAALFGVFILFDEWDSIVFSLLPPAALEVVEPPIVTLGLDRAS